MKRLSAELLRQLRNDIDVALVVERLDIPCEVRGRRLVFRCPDCDSKSGVTSLSQNLARCFLCSRNFNPIDLVMAERHWSFLQAVDYLETLLYE